MPLLNDSKVSPSQPGSAGSAEIAELAGKLIQLRTLAEVEEVALDALRNSLGASWAALYRASETAYARARLVGADESEIPLELRKLEVLELLDDLDDTGVCARTRLVPGVTGEITFCRLQAEFEPHPAVLLLGGMPPAENGGSLPATGLLLDICGAAIRNAELIERLSSQVFIDVLTHCYNRRGFEEHLTVELVRARRYERPLCLLLLDLDDFKLVNDGLGHPVGDYALQRVGETLRSSFRTTDRVCRYGGDEFAVIFPETSRHDVLRLAERLRRQVGKLFPDPLVTRPLTPSIGVAVFPRDANRAEELVKAADRALYRAKEAGRNQVALA